MTTEANHAIVPVQPTTQAPQAAPSDRDQLRRRAREPSSR